MSRSVGKKVALSMKRNAVDPLMIPPVDSNTFRKELMLSYGMKGLSNLPILNAIVRYRFTSCRIALLVWERITRSFAPRRSKIACHTSETKIGTSPFLLALASYQYLHHLHSSLRTVWWWAASIECAWPCLGVPGP